MQSKHKTSIVLDRKTRYLVHRLAATTGLGQSDIIKSAIDCLARQHGIRAIDALVDRWAAREGQS